MYIKREIRRNVRLGVHQKNMTDSTPANYFLIFNRSDEFETQDKISYAVKERDSIHHQHWDVSLNEILRRKLLIRSLEALKYCIKVGTLLEGSDSSRSSSARESSSDESTASNLSSTLACSSQSSVENAQGKEGDDTHTSLSRHSPPCVHSKTFSRVLPAGGKSLEEVKTIDAIPWESTGANATEWQWPVEVLYQHYHVHVVIDFARAFDVSHNGHIFYDRIPDVVQCLMNAVKAALHHRAADTKEIGEWLESASGLSKETQKEALHQVWNPTVLISVTLINVPWHGDGRVPEKKEKWKHFLKLAQGELVSPEMKNFSSYEPTKSSIVSILTRFEVNKVVEDTELYESFTKKLARTLGEYEKASREFATTPGTVLSLESSIEYLLRSAPNTSKYCESIILVTNLTNCSCSSAVSSLEGMVQRKNIIFSIATLNREPVLDSPQLCALTLFMSRIGGFVVNIDFWRSLAKINLNAEWSKRFEGSRCLIQQLFVQLINRFPRASRLPYVSSSQKDSVVVYQMAQTLTPSDQLPLGNSIADAILKALAVARFNENWSVVMHSPCPEGEEANEENEERGEDVRSKVRQLVARSTHYFHQGSLTLQYELTIALPFFDRRVSVRGTKILVYQFCRADAEARSRSHFSTSSSAADLKGAPSETVGSLPQRGKVSYVENFCLHLREELSGEDVILRLMLEKAYSKQLLHFSCAKGVFYKWFNFAAVRSLAVCYDMSKRKDYSSTPLPSISSEDCASRVVKCIELTLQKHNYARIEGAQELVFIRHIDYQPYLVQFFPIGSNEEEPFQDYPAGCLECRISFFFWDWKKRYDVVKEMISILSSSSDAYPGSASYRDNDKIILRTFSHLRSQCLLGAMQELILPRLELPPVHLSNSVALGTSGSVLPMRIPHPSFPFPLKQALTVYWCFSETLIFPAEVRKKCFFFALLRRRQAFDCLVSFGDSLKAILQRKGEMNEKGKESSGMELDYIDASGEHATVKVTRIITNVASSCSFVQGDVEQDFKIFSALSTFFDKVSSQTSSNRSQKIEPLLPYIPSDLDIVVLPSPKCFGHQGVVQLRQCLKRYLKGLDSSQIVESCLFPPSLVRALQTSGGVAGAQLKDVSLSMIVSTKVVVSTNPIQSGSIVFAIMIADDPKCQKKRKEAVWHHSDSLRASAQDIEAKKKLKKDTTLEKGSGSVVSQLVVALVWMNYSRLSQELTSHYRQETSVHAVRNERNAVHISNRRLVEDIRKVLSVRVSLHSTLYMTQYFWAIEKKLLSLGQKERSSLDEMEIEDLLDAVSHLTIFVHEITGESMTALHYVVESVVASSLCRNGNQEKKSESDVSAAINQVLSYLLMQFCKSYTPLSSLWFPREGALGLIEQPPSFANVPVLMKAAVKIQEKGEESRADWISGVGDAAVSDDGMMSRANKGNPLQNLIGNEGWTDHLTTEKTSLKTFVLRLFMLSSMLDEDSSCALPQSVYNPVPYLTSQLLEETPPDSEFFSKRFNGVPLGNVSTTPVGGKLQRLVTVMQNELMGFCLQSCFQHQSYVEMFRLLKEECEGPLREREASFLSSSSRFYTRTDYESTTSGNATTSGLVGLEKKFALLRHSNVEGCKKVRNTPDLQRLLRQVVLPLLGQTTPSCTQQDVIQDIRSFSSEVVEDSAASTSYKSDTLHVAVQEMFQRFKEDGILLLPIQESRHLFVPPSSHASAASVWILVDAQISTEEMCKISVLGHAVDSASVAPTSVLCSLLVDYIKKKTTQFCQLQILKELRHTQQCSEKLLPSRWGDQFRLGPGERKAGVQSLGRQTSTIVSSLQLCGKNVLQLPLYYKLQNQCVSVLKRIGSQCPRLELVPILNQPQCFLVADDNMEDVFHCVRLVFVVDSSSLVSPTDPSHTLKETERCPRLVIQLFSAVDNPAVQRPLEKLQRFCYFLAVQELQGQLNYANILSFHDALFLQQHRREKLFISYCFSNNTSPSEKQEVGTTKGGGTVYGGSSETDGRFALDFVELHLREQDFKFFEVSDDMHNNKSIFLEYYDLQMIEEKTADKVSVVSSKGGKKKEQMAVRRFVKLMEGRNDVLVSCSVHINAADQCVVLEPYCTKEPQERFTNAELEKGILEELKSCEAGSRVLMQLYFRLPLHRKKIPLTALHFLLEDVLRMSAEVSLTHYCFKSFSLEDISTAVLPFLVERLCSALAPFKPCCLQYLGKECSRSTSSPHERRAEENAALPHETSPLHLGWRHVTSFRWKWIEGVQNDPLADEMEFYILCGFQPVVSENGVSVPPTRVVPYIIPKLTLGVSKGTDPRFRTSALNSLEPQMVLKVSMVTESLSIAFFNIRDVHIISTICSRIVEEMSLKSLLLQDLLLQRMGVRPFQSPLSEFDLAHHCCGDATNVIENRSLAIDPQLHRRPEKTLRFPPSSSVVISASEMPPKETIFSLLLESLHNRGWVVNHVFPFDDGVKVLFDESLDLTLQQCDALMQDFISVGFIRPEETSALRPRTLLSHKKATTSHPPGSRGARTVNYRVMVRKSNKWTSEAMIACSCQRHLFSAHIIVEAQNAQSSVQDLLSQCEPQLLQGVRDLNGENELAQTVVLLRSKSQEIFASRVPDFLLLRNCRNLVDDVLEQTLPERSDEGIKHASAVDSILQKLINHLIQVCPSAIVMELDPTCESTLAEPVLVSRLRCRYGKVYSKERNEMIRFCPRLHYAVIPLYDLLQAQTASSAVPKLDGILQEFKGSPIPSCGVFVVEIGFQVSHYALDVFAIKGNLISSSIVASLAADLRCRLSFENMLYDYQVEHIMSHLQHSNFAGPSVHPGQESLLQAVSSLLTVYPFAPVEAKAAVAAIYQPYDSLTIRMKFEAKETKEASSPILFYFIPPDESSHRTLVSANAHQQYYYCGIASTSLCIQNKEMESATNSIVETGTPSCKTFCLFVLLQPVSVSSVSSPLGDASGPTWKTRSQPEDFYFLFCAAKSKLLSVLLRTTREEQIEFAWKRFFSISDSHSRLLSTTNIPTVVPPTIAEYQFVLSDAIKLLLPHALKRIQALLEYVDWPLFFHSLLKKVAEQFYSTVVLHVFTATIESHVVGEKRSSKRKGKHRATVAEADISYSGDQGGARGYMHPIVFALAPVEAVGQSFLVAEGWSRFCAGDHCFRVDVEEVSIIRRLPQCSDGSTNCRSALTSAGIHYSYGMRDLLTQSENELVSIFQSILTRAIWVSVL